MESVKEYRFFALVVISFLFSVSLAGLTGTAVGAYSNQCVQCITNGNDFCETTQRLLTGTGRCCSNLVQYGDYCDATYTYCTITTQYEGGKLYYCPRDGTCTDYTLYFATSDVTEKTVSMGTYTTCAYTFSTTEAPSASSASELITDF